jgi:hypothetical protein
MYLAPRWVIALRFASPTVACLVALRLAQGAFTAENVAGGLLLGTATGSVQYGVHRLRRQPRMRPYEK